MDQPVSADDIFYVRGIGEVLDVLNRIQDLDALIGQFAETVRGVFACDRVFLLYPLDPATETFRIPVEATDPAYPGANEVGVELPMTPTQLGLFEALNAAEGPIVLDAASMAPLEDETSAFRDNAIVLPKSAMITALYPRTGAPWGFGLHQCDRERTWTDVERRLFVDIALRLAETLSNRLLLRELQEREESLRQTTDALLRSNAELQRFAYVAAHDLQEPLCNIVSFSQLLQRSLDQRLGADEEEYFAFVVNGARRIRMLIRDFQDYTQVAARETSFQPVDMGGAVTSVRFDLEELIAETGAEIVAGGLPVVRGDRHQLALVLKNLIGNAIKYRKPDEAPRVEVFSHHDGGCWRFAVRDNGIGIEPQHFERVFELFKRLHTTAAYPGTGIGLALCKRIVERHGGRIWLESEPGRGCTVLFTLPDANP